MEKDYKNMYEKLIQRMLKEDGHTIQYIDNPTVKVKALAREELRKIKGENIEWDL